MVARMVKLLQNRDGAVAIEYALLAIFLAVTIVSVVTGIGGKLNFYFSEVSTALK